LIYLESKIDCLHFSRKTFKGPFVVSGDEGYIALISCRSPDLPSSTLDMEIGDWLS
jgi:hypothetical protein